VSRPQSRTARPWLLRGLLVLLAVAGLGIWPGGHCADDVSAHHTAHAAAISAADTAALATTAMSAPRRDDGNRRGPSGEPSTTADECHITPPTTVTTTVNTAAPLLPADERSAAVAPRPHSLTPCFSPGVALIHLGVSRT
jgi:hypothetical protein